MSEVDARSLWIHCNRCFTRYVHQKYVFFLLACQHISCERCVSACLGRTPSDAPIFNCPMCKKAVRGRHINNNMPENLKELFHPEPWKDGLAHEHIGEFQMKHTKRLDMFLIKKQEEHKQLKKEMSLAYAACQKRFLEHQRLRMDRKQIEIRVRQIKVQVRKRNAQRRLARVHSLMDRKTPPSAVSTATLQGGTRSRMHFDSHLMPCAPCGPQSCSGPRFTRPHNARPPPTTHPQDDQNSTHNTSITSFVNHRNHSFVL